MNAPTLLLINPDKALRYTLREELQNEHFLVLEAAHGQRSIDIVCQHKIDLILLDMHHPADGDAISFITHLREKTDAPLIVFADQAETTKRIAGFACGADDFVSKPFDAAELIARIRAHLRRYGTLQNMEANIKDHQTAQDVVTFAGKIFDRRRMQLQDENNQPVELTLREFQLLEALVLNAGKPLKRDYLCEAIREPRYVPTPRAIDVKITRIRKKIGDDATNPHIIETVRGIGYRFNENIIADAVAQAQDEAAHTGV